MDSRNEKGVYTSLLPCLLRNPLDLPLLYKGSPPIPPLNMIIFTPIMTSG